MAIKHVAKNIGVDAGIILVADLDYYRAYGKGYEAHRILGVVLDVPVGTYTVKWNIENTWNGPVGGEGTVVVTSGKVVVSDPCYLITDQSDWKAFCNKLFALDNTAKHFNTSLLLDSMGGDGEYDVELSFKAHK